MKHRRFISIPRYRLVTQLKICLVSILVSLGLGATSVAAVDPPSLDLQNARLEMPSLTPSDRSARLTSLIDGDFERHVVIRLQADLSEADRSELADGGIRLLTCLGPRVWIASIGVAAVDAVPPEDVLSVNDPVQLAEVDSILRRRHAAASGGAR